MTKNINQNGVSLIAAIFILVVLAFMGVMFVSLINTSSLTSVNDMQSAQALYIAEGGVEFAQYSLAQNLDWYTSAKDPISTGAQNLGVGSFITTTTLPATKLHAVMPLASVNPVRVYTTDNFPVPGCIQIELEFIRYTGTGTTVAACVGQPPCFTNITRAAAACFGGGTQARHDRGDVVYPMTALGTAMPNDCNYIPTLLITANSKLLTAGTLDVEGEEIAYGNSLTSGVTTTLIGVQRCQNGSPSAAHASGAPVTSLQIDGSSPDYEAEVASTGTMGAAARIVRKTIQR